MKAGGEMCNMDILMLTDAGSAGVGLIFNKSYHSRPE